MSLLEKYCSNCAYSSLTEYDEPCKACVKLPGYAKWAPNDAPATDGRKDAPATDGRKDAPATDGRKDDTGKDPWSLLPFDAVRAIVKVLAFGAGKYAPRNWEKGMDWHRPFDACIRHLTAWWGGEKADPETGFSHLWHAGCCILFLIAYEIRGIGKDDRPAKSR